MIAQVPHFELSDVQLGEEIDEDGGSNRPVGMAVLTEFYEKGLITEVVSLVKSGKEATVYCCRAHPNTGHTFLAAKIYRKMDNRTFKNDAVYWAGVSVGKRRERVAFAKKTKVGRAVQASQWMGREHQTMAILHAAGAHVPEVLGATGGALLMEYFGDENGAAPQLQHVKLTREEAPLVLQQVLDDVALWLASHRVHADLSPFNILFWEGQAQIIDFPQAVDPRKNPNAWDLLQRDLENVGRYFARYGLEVDASWITWDLRRQYTDPRYRV